MMFVLYNSKTGATSAAGICYISGASNRKIIQKEIPLTHNIHDC